jgi:hypothetical protein
MFRPYKAIFRQHFYKESNALRTNQIVFFQLRRWYFLHIFFEMLLFLYFVGVLFSWLYVSSVALRSL